MKWQEQVRKVAEFHFGPHMNDHMQRDTARKLGITIKQTHMILEVHAFLNDPEIQKAKGLESAYNIIRKRKKEKKKKLVEDLLTTRLTGRWYNP